MIIKSLELADFRNYEHLEISFDKGTNILYGDNAQGKTNILEAIYVSATTKSHKGSKDKDIINFDKEEAHIRTYLEKDGVELLGYTTWGCLDLISNGTGEMKKRYGFIYIDRDNEGNGTYRRIKKDSFYWYKKVIATNGTELS